jgi:DNA polymerase III beta subunit
MMMKVRKYELARAIDKVKSIVTKNEQFPALSGVLIRDGYLIASNMELTIQVKLEGSAGTEFIIPMKAFDLIKSLPEGEVELTADTEKNIVTIRMDKIKNSYQSYGPDGFSFYKGDVPEENGITLPGARIMEAFGHVLFAAADKSPSNASMAGIRLEGKGKKLNVVALDGHVIAWDQITVDSPDEIAITVPKNAIRKLLAMGMSDDITVSYNKNSAIFRADEYIIYSRLIDGKYFAYDKMFNSGNTYAVIGKKELVEAMTRAKMCVEDNTPTVFDLKGDELEISADYNTISYKETVPMQTEFQNPLRIGFSSKLVLESIKAFTCENISLNFTSAVQPMIVEAEDSDMKVVVLPVKLRA